ncbi:PhzF family phenazine biosynthesis protein [Gemmatimonadota bacterium]
MDTLRLRLIDAFTDTPFTGNPAGVVLDAADLTEDQMQAIAREVHASETAFVCGGGGGEPFRVRFFTPAAEVDLCGHATIATFHALVWEGRVPVMDGEVVVHQDTRAGRLPLRLAIEEGDLRRVMMGQQPPLQEPWRRPVSELAGPLGVDPGALESADREIGPPAMVSTGLKCLHVALPDLDAIRSARPDFRALADLSRAIGVTTVQIVTLETEVPENWAHVRTFAPSVGVDEDPVTGTAGGSLGGYLAYINYLPEGGDLRRFAVEQGVEVGRPGRIEVELQLVGLSVTETWVGGSAVSAFAGEMAIPAP